MVGIAAIVLVVVGGGVYVAATAANLHTNSSVLDLRSDRELSLPATIGIDDQAAWLDDGRLAYGKSSQAGQKTAIFAVAADGSAQPSLMIADASSPVPLH
jgi:hypothetical protein